MPEPTPEVTAAIDGAIARSGVPRQFARISVDLWPPWVARALIRTLPDEAADELAARAPKFAERLSAMRAEWTAREARIAASEASAAAWVARQRLAGADAIRLREAELQATLGAADRSAAERAAEHDRLVAYDNTRCAHGCRLPLCPVEGCPHHAPRGTGSGGDWREDANIRGPVGW